MDLIGKTLGKYQIVEEIGRGGMGAVYRGYDPTLNRTVAVKVLAPHLAWEPHFVNRFLREARMVARLSHPHIVSIFDVGEQEGTYYLVMAFVAGEPLSNIIAREGPLAPQRAAGIVGQVAEALDYAHKQGVVHRDVKPGNILVGAEDRIKLTDFGIARAVEGTRLTGTGMTLGTPEYMSPEQAEGKPADARSDVYSLGIVLYEMLTGRVPFRGETPVATLRMQADTPPPPPRRYTSPLPERAEKVVLKALAKDPAARYACAGAMTAALAEAAEGKARVRSAKEPTHVVVPPAARPTVVKPRRGVKLNIARLAWPWAPIGLLTIAIILAGLWAMRGNPPTASTAATSPTVTHVSTTASASTRPPTATPSATSTRVPTRTPNVAPTATSTPKPSETPSPTSTQGPPTNTPTPTATSRPTDTPVPPTSTPHPPTATPTPLRLGAGAGETRLRPIDGMTMVYVPAGEFLMGSGAGEGLDDEHPQHAVYLDAFWIDKTEVTNAQYQKCVEAGACGEPYYANRTDLSAPGQPVVGVNWFQVEAYCKWAGARLPTEAEWEKAARGPDGRIYPWGNSKPDCTKLNYQGCVGRPKPVGSYPTGASPYGVLDMGGNVSEWVADWYAKDYYARSPDRSPQGPDSGDKRIYRGGSYERSGSEARSAGRLSIGPAWQMVWVGVRCISSNAP